MSFQSFSNAPFLYDWQDIKCSIVSSDNLHITQSLSKDLHSFQYFRSNVPDLTLNIISDRAVLVLFTKYELISNCGMDF